MSWVTAFNTILVLSAGDMLGDGFLLGLALGVPLLGLALRVTLGEEEGRRLPGADFGLALGLGFM